jgi:hypothetical protein
MGSPDHRTIGHTRRATHSTCQHGSRPCQPALAPLRARVVGNHDHLRFHYERIGRYGIERARFEDLGSAVKLTHLGGSSLYPRGTRDYQGAHSLGYHDHTNQHTPHLRRHKLCGDAPGGLSARELFGGDYVASACRVRTVTDGRRLPPADRPSTTTHEVHVLFRWSAWASAQLYEVVSDALRAADASEHHATSKTTAGAHTLPPPIPTPPPCENPLRTLREPFARDSLDTLQRQPGWASSIEPRRGSESNQPSSRHAVFAT